MILCLVLIILQFVGSCKSNVLLITCLNLQVSKSKAM